jgi:hypothetical protein
VLARAADGALHLGNTLSVTSPACAASPVLVDEGLGGVKHDLLDQRITPSFRESVWMLTKTLISYSATRPPVSSFHKEHLLSAT